MVSFLGFMFVINLLLLLFNLTRCTQILAEFARLPWWIATVLMMTIALQVVMVTLMGVACLT